MKINLRRLAYQQILQVVLVQVWKPNLSLK